MKINKTFKKSISILLTVIMILSTFGAAIVPVGAADTTENTSSDATYYLWYSTGNDSNIGGWTKKVTMTATGTNSYYYDLTVNTGGNFYFTINTSSTNPASTPWSSGSDVTSNVTYDSGVKTSFSSSQEYSGKHFPIFSLQQNQTLRFTFTPSKTVVISVAGSTEETTAPTTSPTGDVFVYFDNPSGWSAVNAYIYNSDSDNAGAWPGTAMTYDETLGIYKIKVPSGYENGYIIFNNGSFNALPRASIFSAYFCDMESTLLKVLKVLACNAFASASCSSVNLIFSSALSMRSFSGLSSGSFG